MGREIIVNSESGEVRAAILEDGVLVDLFIERSLHPRYAGNIYRGTVENVLPGMQAAFVDVGLERNVFLYVDDALAGRNGREGRIVREADGEEITVPNKKPRSIKDILKPGQEIMVQVSKEPIGTKGARVVTDITLPGRYVVLMPTVDYVGVSRRIDEDGERDRLKKIAQAAKPKRMGVIVRTVAEGLSQEEIASDIQFLVKLWRRIQARGRRAKAPALLHKDYDLVFRLVRDHFAEDVTQFVVDDPEDLKKVNDLVKMFPEPMRDKVHLYTGQEPIFDSYGLEEEIARALRRKVWLACGGYLVIDHTEALTVIDVNTGKFTGSTCLADTVLKTNLEAATEIARQMRLRNIGGIIIADFIDMDDEDHQKQVMRRLEESLARDKTKASVLGFTQLGLVEMTRKKVQQGLAESMMKVCPMCDGRGRILSEETLAFRAMRAIKKEALSTSQPAM
ncbi:MAG: Rne/Rng family ribonuclease, partial [Firmicutes bacterium]|nr:Rne/Rng family ribonuclease [Bacillota bacterium]